MSYELNCVGHVINFQYMKSMNNIKVGLTIVAGFVGSIVWGVCPSSLVWWSQHYGAVRTLSSCPWLLSLFVYSQPFSTLSPMCQLPYNRNDKTEMFSLNICPLQLISCDPCIMLQNRFYLIFSWSNQYEVHAPLGLLILKTVKNVFFCPSILGPFISLLTFLDWIFW